MLYLFPFDKVEKNEKILLYGGGDVGEQFLRQIMKTQYCGCLAVVDRNYRSMRYLCDVEVIGPEMTGNYAYDKIVIASLDYKAWLYE